MARMHAGVRVEYTQISKLPLERQLALLSKATVLISNIGSRSFRLIYLPNGATTILIGPPECAPLRTPPPCRPRAKVATGNRIHILASGGVTYPG